MVLVRDALRGVAAGATAAVALAVATYADVAIRGCASSDTPAKVAGTLAPSAGVNLASDGDTQTAEHRKSGIGALMGHMTSLDIGAAYGVIRPRLAGSSIPLLAGAVLGLAALAASDVPATVTGATDPNTWGTSGWLADLPPHLAYGLATAAFESFRDEYAPYHHPHPHPTPMAIEERRHGHSTMTPFPHVAYMAALAAH
jgi:hypothetical protein